MNAHQRLIYMANQIARNMATMKDDVAAQTIAEHIHDFWDPRMKASIFADSEGLTPVAEAAIELLRRKGAPAHHTRAAQSGGSDAG